MIWDSAKVGKNVAAQKKLEEMTRVTAADAMMQRRARQVDQTQEEPEQKPQKLGKKEEQQAAAQKVGGIYAVPEGPKIKLVASK